MAKKNPINAAWVRKAREVLLKDDNDISIFYLTDKQLLRKINNELRNESTRIEWNTFKTYVEKIKDNDYEGTM